MIMDNTNRSRDCMDFSVHYYDYMFEGKDIIPTAALEHFLSCENCKAEMELLKSDLETCCDKTNKDEQALHAAWAKSLQLHFAFVDKYVGCNEAKQFFVTMLSGKAIKTPTPITVHVSNCPSCLADYYALQGLDLPEMNLYKIGQLLADDSLSSHSDVEIGLKIFQALSGTQCDKSTIDKLVEIICRRASGVKTVFSLKEEIDQKDISICDEDQIEVSVFNENEPPQAKPEPESKEPEDIKPSASFNISKYLKPIAAAAVLIFAFMLFSNRPVTADYDQIYKALAKIKNVHLKRVGDDGALYQEVWISRELNVKMTSASGKTTLCDIGKKLLISNDTNGNNIESKLDADSIRQVTQTMQVPWSLMPFKSISDIPEGATWQILKNEDELDDKLGVVIYEILWSEKSIRGVELFTKWSGTVDRSTFLLKRTEWWEKTDPDVGFELKMAIEIDYPNTEQMREIVDKFQSQ